MAGAEESSCIFCDIVKKNSTEFFYEVRLLGYFFTI